MSSIHRGSAAVEGQAMQSHHPDPAERWRAIVDFYDDLATYRYWEHQAAMSAFARWVGSQPFASALYPSMSHQFLCVGLDREDPGNRSSLTLCVRQDGQFECKLWGPGTRIRVKTLGPIQSASRIFASALIRLGLDA